MHIIYAIIAGSLCAAGAGVGRPAHGDGLLAAVQPDSEAQPAVVVTASVVVGSPPPIAGNGFGQCDSTPEYTRTGTRVLALAHTHTASRARTAPSRTRTQVARAL